MADSRIMHVGTILFVSICLLKALCTHFLVTLKFSLDSMPGEFVGSDSLYSEAVEASLEGCSTSALYYSPSHTGIIFYLFDVCRWANGQE